MSATSPRAPDSTSLGAGAGGGGTAVSAGREGASAGGLAVSVVVGGFFLQASRKRSVPASRNASAAIIPMRFLIMNSLLVGLLSQRAPLAAPENKNYSKFRAGRSLHERSRRPNRL